MRLFVAVFTTLTLTAGAVAAAWAQPAGTTTFVVQVVDQVTNAGIPDASVSVPGTDRAARTNAGGFATLTPLPGETTVLVRVERVGYAPATVSLSLGGPPILAPLTPAPIPIEGVEVRSILAREG